MAATVSVAQSTLLSRRTCDSVIFLKMKWFKIEINRASKTNPIIVPKIPKKVIIPKFSKNNDFLKLYPAENIIGGSIMVKNISPENCKLSPKV